MSFVLDALKLSEQRRSRFARRIYAHPPPLRGRGRQRKWLAAMAAIAIAGLLYLAWRLVAPVTPAANVETADGAVSPPAKAVVAASENLSSANPGTEAASASVDPQVRPGARTPSRGNAGPPSAARAPALAPAAQSLPEGRPEQPPLDVAPPSWPALTLQMLFYSADDARSFVQINGRNYRSGETLDEGPQVLGIAPDGVILRHQGTEVRLAMNP